MTSRCGTAWLHHEMRAECGDESEAEEGFYAGWRARDADIIELLKDISAMLTYGRLTIINHYPRARDCRAILAEVDARINEVYLMDMTNQNVLAEVVSRMTDDNDFAVASNLITDSGALWVASEVKCHCMYDYRQGSYRFSVTPFACGYVHDKILR
jgi:hypothetical protein